MQFGSVTIGGHVANSTDDYENDGDNAEDEDNAVNDGLDDVGEGTIGRIGIFATGSLLDFGSNAAVRVADAVDSVSGRRNRCDK